MRGLILVLTFALALLMVIFGVQNTQPVNITFFAMSSGSTPLSLVVVISAIAGALIVGLLWLAAGIRHSIQDRRLTKERKTLETRNAELEQKLATFEPKPVPVPAVPALTADHRPPPTDERPVPVS